MERKRAAREAAALILRKPSIDLESLKKGVSSKYRIPALRNSEILREIPESKRSAEVMRALVLRPVRTMSGIANIAAMSKPMPCPGRCIYCPGGKESPKSYTGDEPAAMRGAQNDFDAFRQVSSRLRQLRDIGHSVEKCELIVMGGTFNAQAWGYQKSFVKGCLEAMNGKRARTLGGAKRDNEKAPSRAVGITFETRPDFSKKRHVDRLLELGATRIELGVQTLSNRIYRKVCRGHSLEEVVRATTLCKDSALKVCYHMMPGLFSTPKQDVSMFRRLFSDSRFRPDMLKIYPCMVVKGTELYEMWKRGKYEPYDTEEAAEVLAEATKYIPEYVRVMRVQRDIPRKRIEAGVMKSNLRQIVHRKLSERGETCHCIRCREVGLKALRRRENVEFKGVELRRISYKASGGREVFLSYEGKEGLFGFIRLRIPSKPFRKEIGEGDALVRELHVYGEALGIGKRPSGEIQHRGFGGMLLAEAERVAKGEYGAGRMVVMSGIGVREYYYKKGYKRDGVYVSKKL